MSAFREWYQGNDIILRVPFDTGDLEKAFNAGLEAAAKACLEIANNSKMDDEKFGHENDATYYGRYEGATDCIDAIRAMIEKED